MTNKIEMTVANTGLSINLLNIVMKLKLKLSERGFSGFMGILSEPGFMGLLGNIEKVLFYFNPFNL
jgi:hypothetical protein